MRQIVLRGKSQLRDINSELRDKLTMCKQNSEGDRTQNRDRHTSCKHNSEGKKEL